MLALQARLCRTTLKFQTGGSHRSAIAHRSPDLSAVKTAYRRFGQYSRALDQIRLCLAHRAAEKTELQRMCADPRIPSDFDVVQISWRPDYDRFFYDQLSRRARRIYLFRGEYIFDLEKAAVC